MTEPEPATVPIHVDSTPAPDVVVVEKPRRRRRGPRALIAIIVILAILVAAFFIGDHFAKQYAVSYVRERVATALDLPSSKPVHVDLGTGSIILQAISGRIDDVHVTVAPLTVSGLTGTAALAATGVPLDSNTALTSLVLKVSVPASSLTSKLKSLPQAKALGATVHISGKHIVLDGKVKVLTFSVPIAVSLTPSVKAGKPTFTLDSVAISGHRVPAAQLDRYVPGFASGFGTPQSICIASSLPKELTVTGVSLSATSLTYTLTGSGVKLNDKALSQKGTCAKG